MTFGELSQNELWEEKHISLITEVRVKYQDYQCSPTAHDTWLNSCHSHDPLHPCLHN